MTLVPTGDSSCLPCLRQVNGRQAFLGIAIQVVGSLQLTMKCTTTPYVIAKAGRHEGGWLWRSLGYEMRFESRLVRLPRYFLHQLPSKLLTYQDIFHRIPKVISTLSGQSIQGTINKIDGINIKCTGYQYKLLAYQVIVQRVSKVILTLSGYGV
ncbi:MAG: hypothetical protein WAU36_20165 [Cyclobacteriaceae bacterium]